MGTYNTYGETQIKVGHVSCAYFSIGDKVDIPDGIYVDHNSAIIVKDSIFIAEFENIISKWGHIIECDKIIEQFDYIKKEVKKLKNV